MAVTITINDNSPQAISLIDYLKTLDFVKIKKEKEVDEEKVEQFRKNFTTALQEMKDIRSGKKKAKKLETLLR